MSAKTTGKQDKIQHNAITQNARQPLVTRRFRSPLFDIASQQGIANRIRSQPASSEQNSQVQNIALDPRLIAHPPSKENTGSERSSLIKFEPTPDLLDRHANSSFAETPLMAEAFSAGLMSDTDMVYPDIEPLESLKLLRLVPSKGASAKENRVYEYKFATFPYPDWPEFVALSYVWGDEAPDNTILVNREPTKIRKNLYQALSVLGELVPAAYL
ncbi:hypothetical protein F5Y16DRAFT_174744 [Xylariaceae sp. FL0255]|nr:hypothetical protein F5Y16DRAFT_174744 [Xylariaceae sp. FL0255]